MSSELVGWVDELFEDDVYLSNLKTNKEERYYAWVDRGVRDIEDYFKVKNIALQETGIVDTELNFEQVNEIS